MAEQSHKREMNDAVRGDFERLRARRQRRPAERAEAPERIVLTPPQPSQERETEAPVPETPEAAEPAECRSRLRALFRRG